MRKLSIAWKSGGILAGCFIVLGSPGWGQNLLNNPTIINSINANFYGPADPIWKFSGGAGFFGDGCPPDGCGAVLLDDSNISQELRFLNNPTNYHAIPDGGFLTARIQLVDSTSENMGDILSFAEAEDIHFKIEDLDSPGSFIAFDPTVQTAAAEFQSVFTAPPGGIQRARFFIEFSDGGVLVHSFIVIGFAGLEASDTEPEPTPITGIQPTTNPNPIPPTPVSPVLNPTGTASNPVGGIARLLGTTVVNQPIARVVGVDLEVNPPQVSLDAGGKILPGEGKPVQLTARVIFSEGRLPQGFSGLDKADFIFRWQDPEGFWSGGGGEEGDWDERWTGSFTPTSGLFFEDWDRTDETMNLTRITEKTDSLAIRALFRAPDGRRSARVPLKVEYRDRSVSEDDPPVFENTVTLRFRTNRQTTGGASADSVAARNSAYRKILE